MKTYFMSWRCDNKRGHSIFEFSDDVGPTDALSEMLAVTIKTYSDSDSPLQGEVVARQFNTVD